MTYKGVEAYEAGVPSDSIEITQEELKRSEQGDFIDAAVKDIAAEWLGTTAEGQEFSQRYNSKENRDALDRAMSALGSGVSVETLTGFFNNLKSSGKLKRVYTDEERAVESEKRRLRAYRQFYRESSAPQVKERAKADGDFDAWLKREIDRNTAAPAEEPEPVGPTRADAHLYKLSQIPERVRRFADEYKRLTSNEAKRRTLAEPGFRQSVEEAVSFGIL